MSRGRDLAGWAAAAILAAGVFAGAAVAALKAPPAPSGRDAEGAVALDMSVGVVPMAAVLPSTPPEVPPVLTQDLKVPMPDPAPDPLPERPERAVIRTPIPVPTDAVLPVAEAPPNILQDPLPPVAQEPPLDLPKSAHPKPRPAANVEERVGERAVPQQPDLTSARAEPETRGQEQPAAGAQTVARPAQERREASGREAERYRDAVLKQIARQRRAKAPDAGAVTVGFEIGGDGGLRQVVVVASSGSKALDQVALDHIRQSAPFPPPPAGIAARFAFEFVGR